MLRKEFTALEQEACRRTGHERILLPLGVRGYVDCPELSKGRLVDLAQRAVVLSAESHKIAESLTASVWERLPGYENTWLDRGELAEATEANVRVLLSTVAERRSPTEEELTPARLLGERRAVQGVPIEGMLRSWHNAERVVLDRLLTGDESISPSDAHEAATRIAVAVDAMITASTSAYHEIGTEIYAHVNDAGVDIVSRLAGAEKLDPTEVERRARMIGVETHLPHRAAAVAFLDPDAVDLARTRRRLLDYLRPYTPGRILAGSHHGLLLLLFTDGAATLAAMERAMKGREIPPGVFIGLGAARPRLGETSGSCQEAMGAVRVGMLLGEPLTRYERVIPEILLAENPLAADSMIASMLGPVSNQPEFLETLRVFFSSGLSTRATARALGLHENSVAYRLRRISELLGVETPSQLVRADVLLALRAMQMRGRDGVISRDAAPVLERG